MDRTFTDSTTHGATLQLTGNAPLLGLGNYVTAGFSLLWIPVWMALSSRAKANLGPGQARVQIGSDEAPRPLGWRSYALALDALALDAPAGPD